MGIFLKTFFQKVKLCHLWAPTILTSCTISKKTNEWILSKVCYGWINRQIFLNKAEIPSIKLLFLMNLNLPVQIIAQNQCCQVWACLGMPDHNQLKYVCSEVSFHLWESSCQKCKTMTDSFCTYWWSKNPAIWLDNTIFCSLTRNYVYSIQEKALLFCLN